MSRHWSSAARRSFPLSPDLYGFYRPPTARRWPRRAVLGIGALCTVTLLGGFMLANGPAQFVAARHAVAAAPADTLAGGKQNRADTAAVARPQDAMARFPAEAAAAESAQAPPKLETKRAVAKHAQPARRYAAKKPYHRQAQGYWRNDRYSWGRSGGNPSGGGWSFN